MGRLFFASLFTLSVLSSFVVFVVILVQLYVGNISLGLAVGLTVAANVLFWLAGPFITDLLMRWFYQVRFISRGEAQETMPEVARLIDQVSSEHKFPFPKIGIIPDKNPTAFTYGSARYNARIVLTEGVFHYLNSQEVRSVVAHELGHVVNRDFIVMMIGSTLVQILYEVYAVLIRARGKSAAPARAVALVAYVLYVVGIYFLYYLSRTREYMADEFSARTTSSKDLSDALVKIAYGIVMTEDSSKSRRLLQSTQHMGIADARNARHVGVISYMAQDNADALTQVVAFDRVSPWAKVLELGSTHPLTGNRLARLGEVARACGQPFSFDIDAAVGRLSIDRGKLYGGFAVGLLVYVLPVVLGLAALVFLPLAWLPAAVGVGLLLQVPYRFPRSAPVDTTVLEQMSDPYASPIRGKPVALSGKPVGRGVPGYIFGEDLMFQDRTGLVFLDYASIGGFIGDLFFAMGKTKQLIDVPSRAVGWFYRNISSAMSLKQLETEQETVRSHPMLWRVVLSLALILASVVLTLFWANLPIPDFVRALRP
jgi:Zn-dependent protease with chaperone function